MPRPDILVPHISPPNSRRRAALKAERRGRQILIGFHAEATHRIVDMRECHILRPELFALVAPLRGLLGTLLRDRGSGGVRLTLADQGVDVLLEKVSAEGLEAAEAITDFAQRHALARLAIDDGYGPQTRWEPDPVTIALGGAGVPLPIGAFLQATRDGEAALVAAVRESVGPARIVADLFAGSAPSRSRWRDESWRSKVRAMRRWRSRPGQGGRSARFSSITATCSASRSTRRN